MYNVIKLKFTVIASCGAYIVTFSSKQYLIHGKTENNKSCEGNGSWFYKKKPDNDKRGEKPKAPQKYQVLLVSFSTFLKGSQHTAWTRIQSTAGRHSPIVQSFALFTCHTPAAGTGLWTTASSSKTPTDGTKRSFILWAHCTWCKTKLLRRQSDLIFTDWPDGENYCLM